MSIISQIVGRCHVAETNRQVIRYVISRLKAKEATYWAMPKDKRKELLQDIIEEHRDNISLYVDIQNGWL